MKKTLLLLAALFCLWGSSPAQAATVRFSYPPDTATAYANPYMGNAIWATEEHCDQPFTLVYANLLWRDLEPEEGEYAFDAFEKENNLQRWREEGKHLILRLVADVPGDKKHMDIPQWLYDQTGDGVFYKTSYGRGYSPNYENPVFIAAHRRAVAALGERYGSDPFVAFVQLGSLGHWGEWHVHEKVGKLPGEAVRLQYVTPYLEAFPNAFIMARRPFGFAAERGLGLYNDSSAKPSSTQEWLGWIQSGGSYQGEKAALVPMPEGWQTAPIGGELASGLDAEALLGDDFDQTLNLFAASHTSWIGPHGFPSDVEPGGEWQAPLDRLWIALGYRLRVESAALTALSGGKQRLTLRWQNDGVAPFYFNWTPTLRLTYANGDEKRMELDMDLTKLLPGQPLEVKATLPTGKYSVSVGMVNPATGEAGVQLAMQADTQDGWTLLFSLE